jgi:lipopolysaccharide transport system ATP-binding protein
MTNIAIRAENLGKLYVRARPTVSGNLRQTLSEVIRARLQEFSLVPKHRSATASGPPRKGHVWALRQVSMEIKRGDLVGIMGDNGGGKTTLLRILARITHPTEGYAEIHGQIGTLLEVGAGFHGELSGRENVYLRGRILGMTRSEIHRKFDEMVAFAGLEEFMEAPLKHYSSGMCVRLAFSVAVHQESEILLVDEVLALVDPAFQNKCLEKMIAAADEGRTVLFVSHDLESIRKLCLRGIVFAQGRIAYSGPATEVVDYYRSVSNSKPHNETSTIAEVLSRI